MTAGQREHRRTELVTALFDGARALNGGDLTDDVAVLVVGHQAPRETG